MPKKGIRGDQEKGVRGKRGQEKILDNFLGHGTAAGYD